MSGNLAKFDQVLRWRTSAIVLAMTNNLRILDQI